MHRAPPIETLCSGIIRQQLVWPIMTASQRMGWLTHLRFFLSIAAYHSAFFIFETWWSLGHINLAMMVSAGIIIIITCILLSHLVPKSPRFVQGYFLCSDVVCFSLFSLNLYQWFHFDQVIQYNLPTGFTSMSFRMFIPSMFHILRIGVSNYGTGK